MGAWLVSLALDDGDVDEKVMKPEGKEGCEECRKV